MLDLSHHKFWVLVSYYDADISWTQKLNLPYQIYYKNQPDKEPFNAENKAKRRVRSGPTVVKHNYYQRLQEYRTARCNTYDQKSFHFDEQTSDSDPTKGRCPNVIFNYDKHGKVMSQKESCSKR